MNKLKFILLFFFMLQTPWAFGHMEIEKMQSDLHVMKWILPPHIDQLQTIYDFGITKIGNVKLKSLIRKAKKLEVYLNLAEKPITIDSEERKAGQWSTNAVVINQEVLRTQLLNGRYDITLASILYFHEYLGVLGYEDKNYQLSSILSLTHLNIYYLGKIKDPEAYENFKKLLGVWHQYLDHLTFGIPGVPKGGSSTTGGGGDYAPAMFKLDLINHLMFEAGNLDEFKPDVLSILRYIVDLRIEMDWAEKFTSGKRISMRTKNNETTIWIPKNLSTNPKLYFHGANRPQHFLSRIVKLAKEAESQIGICKSFYGK